MRARLNVTSSLQELLDCLLHGACSPEEFLSELSAYCDATPGSAWEVLAILDQYHRRGKLSADHFRAFRRKIEFHALGISQHVVASMPAATEALAGTEALASTEASAVTAEPDVPRVAVLEAPSGATPDEDEVQRLRAELEIEREKSRRYRHRIATLSEFSRQHRSISRSGVMMEVPPAAPVPATAPVLGAAIGATPAPVPVLARARARNTVIVPVSWMPVSWMPVVREHADSAARRAKALVAVWLAQHRRLQHPRTWTSAAVVVAAATVIAGSSSNLGQKSDDPIVTTTPVAFEPAPQLPAEILEPRTISLSSARFLVLPGNSVATIQVERTGGIGDAAQFKWWTQSAGAKSGQDFVGKSQIAQFEAGQTSVQLPVRILANPKRKHTEMFYVVLGEPVGEATLGDNGRAAVFIMRAD